MRKKNRLIVRSSNTIEDAINSKLKISVPLTGQSWSTYWTSHLYNEADLNLRTKSRSGLSLIDDLGNNPTLLTPVSTFVTGTNDYLITGSYSGITGGGAWDATWKFKLDNGNGTNCLFYVGGEANTSKGATVICYQRKVFTYTSDGTASTTGTFNFNLQDNTEYTLRMQWDGITGHTITMTCNGTVLTSTSSKGWSGDPYSNVIVGRYTTSYFKGTLHSIVGTISGEVFNSHFTGLAAFEFDPNGTVTKKWSHVAAPTSTYKGNSTYYMDYGYSVQTNGATTYYIPNKVDGSTFSIHGLIAGTTLVTKEVEGMLTKHNLWKSKVRFSNAFFDRSNATIWNDTCRAADDYDSNNTKDFNIDKLNFITLKSFLNDGYAGRLFLKFDDNSIDGRGYLDEIIFYNTDIKAPNELKVLQFTQDIRRTQRDINGSRILDANGYAEIYLYENLGENATGNFAKWQSLLNTGDVVLPYTKYDVILISQPLYVPSGRRLTVNCELRIKKGTTVNLTSDVSIGDTVINVDSVVGFNAGEWVVISDDTHSVTYSGQTRNQACASKILSVGVSSITLETASIFNAAVAQNGVLAHCQSVVNVNGVNAVVSGSGIINGMMDYQYNCEPVIMIGETVSETPLCGNGIGFYNSTTPKIVASGLTVKNNVLHGIFFSNIGVTQISSEIGNVVSDNNHDKNIILLSGDSAYLHDIVSKNAKYEDGITFYGSATNFTLSNITTYGNTRMGINFLIGDATGGVMNNITMSDRFTCPVANLTVNTLKFINNPYKFVPDLTGVVFDTRYSCGYNIIINDLLVEDLIQANVISLQGGVHDITFNDAVFNRNNGVLIQATNYSGGVDYPDDIVFDGGGVYDHTGTKTAINASADVTFTDFVGIP
jgi:hypothetical protein